MNKRVIAIIAAGGLAVVGVGTLGLWAKQADSRAYAGAELTRVVQVTDQVPANTKGADLAASTKIVKLPSSSIPDGAVKDLSTVADETTNAQLEPGEVLLASRMSSKDAEQADIGGVPRGKQEMSLTLDAARLAGGQLKPGDTVGVLASFQSESSTSMALNRIVVTRTDFSSLNDTATGDATISLAVTTRQAELLANAAEFGKIWLTKQNAATDTESGKTITASDSR